MAVKITLHGANIARSGQHEVRARGNAGPICPLARQLIAGGCDPTARVHVYRGETLCFTPASLRWWADRQCRESDALEPRFYEYQEFWGVNQ